MASLLVMRKRTSHAKNGTVVVVVVRGRLVARDGEPQRRALSVTDH